MSLIAERHPRLGRLLHLWRSRCAGNALPIAATLDASALGDLAQMTVLLARGGDGAAGLTIATSGAEVDALFGVALAGGPLGRLASVRGDAGQEAWAAIETPGPSQSRTKSGWAITARGSPGSTCPWPTRMAWPTVSSAASSSPAETGRL